MTDVRIEIDDRRLLQALRQTPERIMPRLEAALARGAMEIARAARRKAPKAFSTLTNSIRDFQVGPGHFRISPGVNYAPFVELGRAPGKVPGTRNGLREWVKQKTGLSGAALDRRTFAVARSIARKGIRPRPFMAPAAEENADRVRELVRAAGEQALREVFGG